MFKLLYSIVYFRHAIGQFAVRNLLYGPKFQKQMFIYCSSKSLYLAQKKRSKESYKTSVNLEDLDVEFVLQHFKLCYVLTKPMKKLNRNHIEEDDSSELFEILSQYTDSLKKKKSDSFDKYV